jgi:hypothetical protein
MCDLFLSLIFIEDGGVGEALEQYKLENYDF